jgi:AhpD family alkylhydroperoxidase
MQARMKNPGLILDVNEPIQKIIAEIQAAGVEQATLDLVHMRASQINGCGWCVQYGARAMRKAGESEDRVATVVAWRDVPYFTDAERAALALAEAATRLADRSDAVPDEIWDAAAGHFDEKQLAAIVLMVAMTNFFNRINVTTRQVAGSWG